MISIKNNCQRKKRLSCFFLMRVLAHSTVTAYQKKNQHTLLLFFLTPNPLCLSKVNVNLLHLQLLVNKWKETGGFLCTTARANAQNTQPKDSKKSATTKNPHLQLQTCLSWCLESFWEPITGTKPLKKSYQPFPLEIRVIENKKTIVCVAHVSTSPYIPKMHQRG